MGPRRVIVTALSIAILASAREQKISPHIQGGPVQWGWIVPENWYKIKKEASASDAIVFMVINE
jgi:hypothetical protein